MDILGVKKRRKSTFFLSIFSIFIQASICDQRYLCTAMRVNQKSTGHAYLYDTNNMAGAVVSGTRTVVVEIKYFCIKNVVIH